MSEAREMSNYFLSSSNLENHSNICAFASLIASSNSSPHSLALVCVLSLGISWLLVWLYEIPSALLWDHLSTTVCFVHTTFSCSKSTRTSMWTKQWWRHQSKIKESRKREAKRYPTLLETQTKAKECGENWRSNECKKANVGRFLEFLELRKSFQHLRFRFTHCFFKFFTAFLGFGLRLWVWVSLGFSFGFTRFLQLCFEIICPPLFALSQTAGLPLSTSEDSQ